MKEYAGIDVSLEYASVCVVHADCRLALKFENAPVSAGFGI
ncbi:hypothetical protein [Ensifer aridi]|nr:hypothetical protein [Ensifer aridi]